MSDPFAGRSEITADEYRSWVDRIAQDERNALHKDSDASRSKRPATVTTARLKVVRESAFRDTVVDHAKRLGWRCYWTWNSKHSPAGFPDILAVRGRRIIAAELKVPPRTVTPEQHEWLLALSAAGVETYLWIYDDPDRVWAEIVEVLS